MIYTLPQLQYSYDALDPYIDANTMVIHHTKHHQAYVNNLNNFLERYPQIADKPLEELLSSLDNQPFEQSDKLFFRNNAGGVVNHNFFWKIMGPQKDLDEKLIEEIKTKFGSVAEFKKIFSDVALKHFGSGWAWLVKNEKGLLEVYSLPNQDSPFIKGHTPLIALDVWEHAYYLKYQNRRAEYIENWWNVLKLI